MDNNNNGVAVPHFRLLINGSELSADLLSAVEGITLEDEINLPTMFTIKFAIVNLENASWRGIDLITFKPGDEVKVFMGMDSAIEMMTGEITSLDLTFGESSFMEIRGYDRLHRLRFGKKRRSFKDMKDSDIAASIASEINLTPQIEDTGTDEPYLFQNNQSNYEFLLERARRIGFEMLVNDKTFIFQKSLESKAPELSLEYDIDLESFSVQLRTLTEGSEVEIRGWDIKKKEEITAIASSGSETTIMAGKEAGYKLSQEAFYESPVAILDEVVIDATDAEGMAKARFNDLLKEFMKGEGKCGGTPIIRAGKTLEIKGIGERFSGIYYVVSTVHTINEEGYTTTFKVKRTGI